MDASRSCSILKTGNHHADLIKELTLPWAPHATMLHAELRTAPSTVPSSVPKGH